VRDYGATDVRRLVGLSAAVLRALVRQRHVQPVRGSRGALRFSFQDLIALRTAHALGQAGLSTRRITRALRVLRQHLPAQLPLSGLSIRAGGEHVVVRQAGSEWEGGSGQYLLALEVSFGRSGLKLSATSANTAPLRVRPTAVTLDAEGLFLQALEREDAADGSGAMGLYRRCLRMDARHPDARVNLARLLHETGQFEAAERLYLHVSCASHAVAQFNLAVLMEDQGRIAEAVERYLSAVALDPAFADAHHNLARLYELQGNAAHTIRHLHALQRLGVPPLE
jgi:tetratricopeptide (TPR) repeat protein